MFCLRVCSAESMMSSILAHDDRRYTSMVVLTTQVYTPLYTFTDTGNTIINNIPICTCNNNDPAVTVPPSGKCGTFTAGQHCTFHVFVDRSVEFSVPQINADT